MGVTKKKTYTEEQLRVAAFFRALGHPARVAIVQQLLAAGCCICKDFGAELDLAQPTISRHLKELKAADVICGSTQGTRVSYCINPLYFRRVERLLVELDG